ncbi:MAG: 30S ribosome-binding factor RbfA [Deltaproteobacteria bacterium]|nr:30S ribosome-binding factor RbfA [Deltaproteobacteria bacterium]
MLAGKRAVRVGDQILKEIAELLVTKVKDPRVKATTLTGIHLSDDLKHARVYYSAMGDEEDIIRTQAGLDSAKGFIKRKIGLRMDLRYVPDIVFEHDLSLEKGNKMERLFEKIKLNEPKDVCE